MLKKIIYASLIVIWCIIIFALSSMPSDVSGDKSKEFLKKATIFTCSTAYKIGITTRVPSAESIDRFVNTNHNTFRKLCHASEFFVLATIIMFAIRKNSKCSLKIASIATFIICFVYSLTDELHQTFVQGRGGMFSDCLIDSGGAILAIAIYLLAKRISINHKKRRT